MLEQKTGKKSEGAGTPLDLSDDGLVVPKATLPVDFPLDKSLALERLEYEESCIDLNEPVYLITWAPDPKEMLDTDFYLQHNHHVSTLTSFLKCCSHGVFCVESTQEGHPHYHGWYQTSPQYELGRIAVVKTMRRYAPHGLKITTARSIKIFNWSSQGNGLWYYKKDILDSMLTMDPNPIYLETETTVDFQSLDLVNFFAGKRINFDARQKISDREFYRKFYADSVNFINCAETPFTRHILK